MGEFGFGYGLNYTTGRTGVGYNVDGWQTHTVTEVVPKRKDDDLRSREDTWKRSKKRDDDDASGNKKASPSADDAGSVTSAVEKAKAAKEEAARKKEEAARKKEEAKALAEQKKADAAYVERFAKFKPLLTGAGLGRVAELLGSPRFVRSTGYFRGEEAIAHRVGGYLMEGWSITGVEDQQRSRPRKGLLGKALNESYTVQVIHLKSPNGKTVSVDAAEKRE